MNSEILTAQEVARFLGVSLHTLRAYRQRPPDDPLHLPGTRDPSNGNVVLYDLDTVMDWVCKHKRYADHVLAQFAPKDIVRAVTDPLPIPLNAQPQPHGLFGLHSHQPTQDQQT